MKTGWEVKPLGDVILKLETVDPRKSPDETFSYIDVSSVSKSTLAVEETTELLGSEAPSRARRKVRTGDTIIATIRPTLQRIAHIAPEHDQAVCSTGYMVLRTDEQVAPRYIYYYLQGSDFSDVMKILQKGASYPAVTDGEVKSQPIPLPPLEEQKRIVAVLDAAFEGLTRARAHIETNLQNARELFESSLEAALSDIASQTTDMTFGDPEIMQIVDGDRGVNYPKKSDFYPSGFCLFLSTKNVRPNGFEFDECMFVSKEKDAALRKGKLIRRDVLLTTRGTIGNIAIYDDSVEFDEIRINSGMLILRPNEERLLSEYLFEALRSRFVKDQIASLTSGAAQPQLPIKTLNEIVLPVPDTIELQQTVVGKLKTFAKQALELETHYRAKLQDLDDLRQSLLQKAFAGELT